MAKQLKLGKNSFTLFETLLSIVILSIIIVSFSKLTYYDNFEEEFMLLNRLDNQFTQNSFDTNFTNKKTKITIIKNENIKEELLVNEIRFQSSNLLIKKYELEK